MQRLSKASNSRQLRTIIEVDGTLRHSRNKFGGLSRKRQRLSEMTTDSSDEQFMNGEVFPQDYT